MLRRTIGVVLSLCFLCLPLSASATPSILDTLNLTPQQLTPAALSFSWTYTVPSGGTNKVEVVEIQLNNPAAGMAATQNGSAMSCQLSPNPVNQGWTFVCWLAAPTTGTLQISWSSPSSAGIAHVFTLQDAKQTGQPDAPLGHNTKNASGAVGLSATTTPTTSGDLLVALAMSSSGATFVSHGAGQAEFTNSNPACCWRVAGSSEATTTTATGSMSENFTAGGVGNYDIVISAWAPAPAAAATPITPPGLIQFQ